MSAIEARLDPLYPPLFRGWQAYVQPFIESSVGNVRRLLWLLLGAVSVVLLISWSNVANLLAARAAGRTYEMGVRTALGAERVRLVRQMLTEALLLAAGGGALGVLLAMGAIRAMVRTNPGEIPRLEETSLDVRVLLFSAGITIATGLLFGLLPALAASRVDVTALLKQGARSIAGPSKRLRSALIVTEVALAVILLAAAGLLVRSYLNVLSVDTGFNSSTLTMGLPLDAKYRTPEQGMALYRSLIGRIRNLPGIQEAGMVSALPLSHRESITFVEVKGYANRKDQMTNARSASGGYFEAMGIRLLAGRFLTDDDSGAETAGGGGEPELRGSLFPRAGAVGGEIRTGGGADCAVAHRCRRGGGRAAFEHRTGSHAGVLCALLCRRRQSRYSRHPLDAAAGPGDRGGAGRGAKPRPGTRPGADPHHGAARRGVRTAGAGFRRWCWRSLPRPRSFWRWSGSTD